jgi:hypothetical protein
LLPELLLFDLISVFHFFFHFILVNFSIKWLSRPIIIIIILNQTLNERRDFKLDFDQNLALKNDMCYAQMQLIDDCQLANTGRYNKLKKKKWINFF